MVNLRGGAGVHLALVVCAVSVAAAGTAQARRPGPYEEVLGTEGARLAAQAAQPEAAGALAALATLDEDVEPAALEGAVRGGIVK